ncbi:hypothetical protein BDN71DRAFT_1430162 [Pleurotus eryngii]|uniref:Uncharacterized protein n=1 Tax=Pleurotus eryngii TaxID=5323 RepID=A0A9P6DGX0_PLEER|nr:hypothetical protein BDN71DRAFT_1430162 [Pleurotus eryngii]
MYLDSKFFINDLMKLTAYPLLTCIYVKTKDIWSIVKIDICKTYHEQTPLKNRKCFKRLSESVKATRTFDHIVHHTNKYTVLGLSIINAQCHAIKLQQDPKTATAIKKRKVCFNDIPEPQAIK